MSSFRKSLVGLAGLLALVSAVAILTPRTGLGQPNAPIPTQLNVHVKNTLLDVRDVDNPARQPVQADAECSSEQLGCFLTIYTVPAGKRLVIEYASMEANIPEGQITQLRVTTVAGGVPSGHRLPLSAPSVTFGSGGGHLTSVGQQVRLYADPGTSVVVVSLRTSNVGTATFRFTISGHLVDVP